LETQKLQQLREKQNLADVLVSEVPWQLANLLCCGQGELENKEMGNSLEGVFFPREGVFLLVAEVVSLS
jgi:hypothetical protein